MRGLVAREAVKRWRGDERGGEDRRGKEMRGMRGEARTRAGAYDMIYELR